MDEFWVALIAALIYIPLIMLWAFSLIDIFTRRDLSGWGKAAWVLAIFVLPLIGTLIYIITRPVTEIEISRMGAGVRSEAEELERLSALEQQGRITPEEYQRMKLRIIGGAPARAA
jgi:hypothetical protein